MTGRVVLLTSELYFGGFTDYVMLCEDVFRQFSLSKGEAGLVCSSDTKRFHGVVASASSSKLGCGWTQTPALRHQHKHTQTHPVLHSFAGRVYSRCACLLASSTLRCHNRRDSHECTDTESTLCWSERMSDCCATHISATPRNPIVPPVHDLWCGAIISRVQRYLIKGHWWTFYHLVIKCWYFISCDIWTFTFFISGNLVGAIPHFIVHPWLHWRGLSDYLSVKALQSSRKQHIAYIY